MADEPANGLADAVAAAAALSDIGGHAGCMPRAATVCHRVPLGQR